MSALVAGVLVVATAAAVARASASHPRPSRCAAPTSRSTREPSPSTPGWVVEACRQVGGLAPVPTWLAMRVLVACALGAAAVTAGPIAALLVVAAALAVPRAVTPALRRRRLRERDQQLPSAFERVASAIRAGSLPGAAVVEVARDLPAPLGDELRSIAAGIAHGDPLASALARWSQHPDASRDVVLAASALGLGARAGGQVARAVDGVAATLRERRELQAEVRALATQARSSAWLLAAAPLVFAVLVASIEPGAVRFLLTTAPGVACLTGGLLLDALGVTWMARIVRGAA